MPLGSGLGMQRADLCRPLVNASVSGISRVSAPYEWIVLTTERDPRQRYSTYINCAADREGDGLIQKGATRIGRDDF